MKSGLVFDKKGLKLVDKKMSDALELTAHVIRDEVRDEGIVPFDKGTLRGEAMYIDAKDVSKGEVRIGHSTVYARRLYFHPEYNFQTTNSPFAQAYWFAPWLKGGRYEKRFSEVYAKLLEREL